MIDVVGISVTLWMHRKFGSKMPPLPSSALQAMWSANRWLGILLGPTGSTFSISKKKILRDYAITCLKIQIAVFYSYNIHCSFFIRYGGGSFSFSNLINGVTKRFSTEFELQQVCDLPLYFLSSCTTDTYI